MCCSCDKLPVSVDNLLIDIFYHFKHSSKRWSEFVEIRDKFSEIKPLRVLKLCTTCWLSLKCYIKWLLELWPPLYAYFDHLTDGDNPDDHVHRVAKHLSDLEVKLFCHFLSYTLKLFNNFSITIQTQLVVLVCFNRI